MLGDVGSLATRLKRLTNHQSLLTFPPPPALPRAQRLKCRRHPVNGYWHFDFKFWIRRLPELTRELITRLQIKRRRAGFPGFELERSSVQNKFNEDHFLSFRGRGMVE